MLLFFSFFWRIKLYIRITSKNKRSKYGEFTACSNYPECKFIKTDKEEAKELMDCPNCGGKIVEKKTRRGKIFYGCNNYPKCDLAMWDKPNGQFCPDCNSLLVESKDKIKCIKCEYEK